MKLLIRAGLALALGFGALAAAPRAALATPPCVRECDGYTDECGFGLSSDMTRIIGIDCRHPGSYERTDPRGEEYGTQTCSDRLTPLSGPNDSGTHPDCKDCDAQPQRGNVNYPNGYCQRNGVTVGWENNQCVKTCTAGENDPNQATRVAVNTQCTNKWLTLGGGNCDGSNTVYGAG